MTKFNLEKIFSKINTKAVLIVFSILIAATGILGLSLLFSGQNILGFSIALVPLVYIIVLTAFRRHESTGAKVVYSVALVVFYIYAFAILYMLLWAVLQSLKTAREFGSDMISLPKNWLFKNYLNAFKNVQYHNIGFFAMFINSIWYSAGLTFLNVFVTSLTGYVFAKYNFWGKGIAFSFILLTLSIPIVGSLPSQYKIIYTLHLNDSLLFLLTGLGGLGSHFLISYAFFKGIDKTYTEAANMDGAGHLRVFLQIMLPLASGLFVSLFILGFIGKWNDYENAMLFLDKMPTLAAGLYYYRLISARGPTEYLAGVIVTMIPTLILVTAFGGCLMKSMTIGGVKG